MLPSCTASILEQYEIYGIDIRGPTQRGACGIWSRSSQTRMHRAFLQSRFMSMLCIIYSMHVWCIQNVVIFYSFCPFVQQTISADYRRPGRPRGSRDRAPRSRLAKQDAAIRHIDTSLDGQGSRALELCCHDRTQVFEETAAQTACESRLSSVSEQYSRCSTPPVPISTDSAQDDPFHADWPFW